MESLPLVEAQEVSAVHTVVEREDKFVVDDDWAMPDLESLVPGGGERQADTARLESAYLDTPTGALRAFGITLRRRTGDGESGWQLKVPNGTARTELHSRSKTRQVPTKLRAAVAALVADESLEPLVTISTSRTAHRLVNPDGELICEVADDVVQATRGDGQNLRSWREVEVELGSAGTEDDLQRVGSVLRSAGARPSPVRNKVQYALDGLPSDVAGGATTLGDLVAAYLATQCEVIACNDVALRTGESPVHKTRVAVRRLRSTLRVFKDVVDPGEAEVLGRELAWYADLLGEVRDRDVLTERLVQAIEELPVEHVLGPVHATVVSTLAQERKAGADRLDEALNSPRYHELLRRLRQWRTAPPLTDAAAADPAAGRGYVKQARKKAAKRLRNADQDIEQLHRARKAFKRARYAAELAEPSRAKMRKIAKQAKRLQTTLGEHQDCVVAAAFLARLGAITGSTPGHNGFTYGLLMANQLHRAAAIRAALAQ